MDKEIQDNQDILNCFIIVTVTCERAMTSLIKVSEDRTQG